MWPLTAAFVDIALHRSSPDRLPADRFLIGLLLTLNIPVRLFGLYLAGPPRSLAYLLVLGDTVAFLVFVYFVLRYFGRRRRFLQTASALLGTDTLFNLIAIPIAAAQDPAAEAVIVGWVYLVLFLWSIDVAGFVISKAVEQPYLVGIMFVILYVVPQISIFTSLTSPTS